jgi:hypothetical protein
VDDLLKLALEGHGGLERWRQFNVVTANASITGALWHLKGNPDVLKHDVFLIKIASRLPIFCKTRGALPKMGVNEVSVKGTGSPEGVGHPYQVFHQWRGSSANHATSRT